ncbi:uncharacterized protein LOC127257485 isoform X2 [Andrographis paniculata]|uniref:uncharacterized protein LOC127257485 isoform X2 n=1 Tax=Andrographis paniculata TaxID=175694 RepID=UPI0021E92924|nr:uncharacterized protein LOC127257485 isoform X2 [Andrographis paniculata]
MDFHGMKRRELQALCKKHKIPANLSNHEMANRLSEILKENEEPLALRQVKGQEENAPEIEIVDVVMDRKAKKVRFSPNHELFEFTRSINIKRRSKRNSVSIKSSSLSVENVDGSEINNGNVCKPGNGTRSRGSKLTGGKENGKKRGRNGVNCHDQKSDVAFSDNLVNSEVGDTDVNVPRRTTRSRGKVGIEEAARNESKQERKRENNGCEREKNALDNDDDKLNREMVEIPRRPTRSQGQKLEDVTELTGKGVETTKHESKQQRKRAKNNHEIERSALDNGSDDKLDKKLVDIPGRVTRSRGQKLVESAGPNDAEIGDGKADGMRTKNNSKAREEVLKNQEIAEAHANVGPPIVLRRSRRNANSIDDSEIIDDGKKEKKKGEIKAMKKTRELVTEGSSLDTESIGAKIVPNEMVGVQVKGSNKLDRKRRNTRKSGKDGIKSQEGTAQEDSKEENNKLPQATEVVRRSKRGASSLKPISNEEKLNISTNVENKRTTRNSSKNKSSDFGGHCILQPENEARKRKKGSISDDVKSNSEPNSLTLITSKENGRKKVAPAAATGVEVVSKRMQDATSQEGYLKTEDSSIVDAQQTEPEVAPCKDLDSINGMGADNLIGDVELTSSRKSPRMKKDANEADGAGSADPDIKLIEIKELAKSGEIAAVPGYADLKADDIDPEKQISFGLSSEVTCSKKSPRTTKDANDADGAGSADSDIKLIERNELAKSGEIAAVPGYADLKADDIDPEKQISFGLSSEVDTIHLPLEFDAQGSTEQCISETDSYENEPHFVGRTEDSGCKKTTDSEVLPEDKSVSGNISSADSLLLCPADFNSNLKETEGEERKHEQPTLDVANNIGELNDISVPKSLEYVESELVTVMRSSIDCQHSNVIQDNPYEGDDYVMVPKVTEAIAFESCEAREESFHSVSVVQPKEPLSSKLRTMQKDEITAEGNETDEGGLVKDDKDASAEDNVVCLSNEFNGEESERVDLQGREMLEAEISIAKSGDEGMHNDSLLKTDANLDSSPCDHIVVKDEDYNSKSMHLESGGADQGISSEDHTSNCNEDNGEFTLHLFDAERGANNTSKDGEAFSAEYSMMGSNEEGCSSLPEITPSKLSNASESHRAGAGASETSEGKKDAIYHDIIPRDDMSRAKAINDGESEVANQVDENDKEDAYESEHQNSPLINPIAVASPVQDHEAWNSVIENGNVGSTSKSNSEGVVQVSNAENDANDANRGANMEDLVSTCTTDVTMSISVHKGGFETLSEGECEKMDGAEPQLTDSLVKQTLPNAEGETNEAEPSQSWTEIDLNNLFGTPEEDTTSAGRTITPLGAVTTPLKRSTLLSSSLIKKDEEIKGERGSKSAKLINAGCSVAMEDNQLELLFATPCNVIQASANDKTLETTAVIVKECSETMMEDIATQMNVDEEMGDARQGFENNFCLESASLDDSEEVTKSDFQERLNVELVNTHTSEVPLETEFRVCKPSEEKLTEIACEETESKEEAENVELVAAIAPFDAEYKVPEEFKEATTGNIHNWKEEETLFPKSTSEAEYNVCEVPTALLTANTCEYREETMPNEIESVELVNPSTTTVPIETEFQVYGDSGAKLVEYTCEHMEEILFSTEVQYEEPLPENTCASEVHQEAEFNVCAPSVEEFSENACEPKGETKSNEVGSMELACASTDEVVREVESYCCDASEGQVTEISCEVREEVKSVAESLEEDIFTLEQLNQCAEASVEKFVSTPSGNLDEADAYLDMLMDTEYSESLSYGSGAIAKSTMEEAFDLSHGEFQKSNVPEQSYSFSACNADDDTLRDASVYDYSSPVDGERATLAKEEGSLFNASDENDKAIIEYADFANGVDDSCEDDNPRLSHDIFDELHGSSEVAINKTSEADKSANTNSTCKETVEERIITPEDALDTAPAAGQEPPVCVDDILSSLDGNENSVVSKHDTEDIEGNSNSTPASAKLSIPELHSEAGKENLDNNADSITENIDTEYSFPATSVERPLEDTIGELPNPNHDIVKPSVETAESASGSLETSKSIDLTDDTELEMAPSQISPKLHSTVKRNARTILIHGTPRKQIVRGVVDMKENAPAHKTSSNIGDFTTARPKRKALQDVKR